MDYKKILYYSAYISLYLQLITGAVGGLGLFIKLKPEDQILFDILKLETIVQFIEFVFYYWLVRNFDTLPDNVTAIRYIDWNITTPLMLISTVMYMKYNTSKDKKRDYKTVDVIEEDIDYIINTITSL